MNMKILDENVNHLPHPVPHILLAGCGSVGSFLAVSLSRVCHRLTLVDPDVLEPHNTATHTIAFTLCDRDSPKSYALKLTLDAMYVPCHIHAIHSPAQNIDFSQLDNSRELKYIIIATDTVESRRTIISTVKNSLDSLPSLEGVIDTGIDQNGYRISYIPVTELQTYLNVLDAMPERQPHETRACEFVRNVTVISALASALLQLLAKLEEQGREEQEERRDEAINNRKNSIRLRV